ncbi:transglycosylase domain-containing protein [Aestuariibaculum suncheonense]|uniref:Transglycosylase domain-containing protein n=1 Tax=Aestuariibaculum suncheonense TaxID=1028745 RepID=A0A8J6Q3Y8_9FLAO|nr:transglycosylase domain-containing protein [Aestuariibaculum suncheonense]MBD0834004.1 transglycosylase domain-containing protein [Aestuariibaculum suncheonense]
MKVLLKRKWIKWAIIVGVSVVGFFALIYVSVFLGVFGKLPTKEDLSSIKQAEATQLLDKNGKLIGKYYIYDRQPLEFNQIPKHIIDALVATEDVRFYEHDGVDNVSLLRVFVKSIILRDRSSGGGSTITLQLAKNLFGRKDYAVFSMLINKFKESIIAKRIEDIYSKNDILTMYFNTVPFPDNTYGIESASRKFFNKPAIDLNYSEAAALIGTLKATSYYNPRLHIDRTQSRRNVVFQQMEKYDYLTEAEVDSLRAQQLVLNYKSFNHDVGLAPYFRETVKKELTTILETLKKPDGEPYDLYRDGLVVHTTLDSTMQALAEASMKEHLTSLQRVHEQSYGKYAPWNTKKVVDAAIKTLPAYKMYKANGLTEKQILDSLSIKRKTELFEWTGDTIKNVSTIDSLKHYLKFLNTGMLSVEPQTGAIRAYVGGIDYRFFKYDHVSQSERQVGSTFKPFVYTAAIEDGMKPCTYFSLSAVTYTDFDDWTPTNAGAEDTNDEYLNYNLETALSQSVNTIAVKVLNKVGIEKVVEQAAKMGIQKELPQEPSLALGVAEINLKELTGAYASYVNESKPVKPYAISKITDKNGHVIAEFKPEITEEQAYSDYTREVMLQIMQSTVNSGTATRLRSYYNLKNDIAGKTGTTQNNKDGWFVGITPKLVTVTWVGNDNHSIGFKTTGIGQGANSALPIFAKFYQKLNADAQFNTITKSKFETPSDAVLQDLDCEPEKRDGFLKRLFGNKKKERKFKRNN